MVYCFISLAMKIHFTINSVYREKKRVKYWEAAAVIQDFRIGIYIFIIFSCEPTGWDKENGKKDEKVFLDEIFMVGLLDIRWKIPSAVFTSVSVQNIFHKEENIHLFITACSYSIT